ncbi:MAG TPA: hypothetical protein VLF69_03190 [Candidatus Saccharimonadales bacterium]|nr:hypothetical protein [Candidatus Saccharimonadales bacterium]
MPPKEQKIVDVASPGKNLPSASGRPLLVTNRPVLSDPMVTNATPASNEQPVVSAPVINRTAKTIAPVSQDLQDAPAKTQTPEPPAAVEPPVEPANETITTAKEVHQDEPAAPAPSGPEEPAEASETVRDSDAEASAEAAKQQAAEDARAQELERLIESGTYSVPIDAVQRKRSRIFVAVMCVLSLVLLAALADVALDANLVPAPTSVPHTHFFAGR